MPQYTRVAWEGTFQPANHPTITHNEFKPSFFLYKRVAAMKIFPVKLHRAAFFFSVVLSLFTSAKGEDHSLQNSEYKTIEILSTYHDPATHEEAMCQSLPNSAGEIVFLKRDATAQDPILYMKKKDGTTTEFFSYGAGIVKVSPPATEEILWLNDDCFVCVSSGRRNSYYAIYRIARGEPDNTMLSTHIYQLAEGCYRFKVNWHVENGILKASSRYSKTISQIDIL